MVLPRMLFQPIVSMKNLNSSSIRFDCSEGAAKVVRPRLTLNRLIVAIPIMAFAINSRKTCHVLGLVLRYEGVTL